MEFWLGAAFTDTRELDGLARAADRLGYDAFALSDHIFYTDYTSTYPYTEDGQPRWDAGTHWPDVWVTIGALAAVTERLHFATNVYVAPARDVFTVAKAVSTAAVLSGNRIRFGVGVGWCEDEFRQTGQDFSTRGRRLDEMIGVLRALWAGGPVEHHGDAFDFRPLSISPVPGKPIPVLIGGDSEPALRRAARIGDGWIGNRVYTEDELSDVLGRLGQNLARHGRTLDDIQVIAGLRGRPDPDMYKRCADRGLDGTMCAPWWKPTREEQERYGSGLDLKIAAMERFAADVIARM
ncbi:MAG: TIGR03619 family F420-dependent LLM class oxidoreductase [Micromonosporaceae bacterium]